MPVLGIKTSMDDNYGLLSDKLLGILLAQASLL